MVVIGEMNIHPDFGMRNERQMKDQQGDAIATVLAAISILTSDHRTKNIAPSEIHPI
jgi:hypothetical protein